MGRLQKKRFIWLFSRDPRGRQGAAAVEFALLFPIILAILLGILEFGSIMYVRHVMFFAAREAARNYVTGTSTSTAEAVTAAETALSEGNARGTFTVTASTTGLGTSTAYVTVTVSTPMADAAVVDAITSLVLSGRTMTSTATMYLDPSSTNNTSCGNTKGSCSAVKTATKTKAN